MFYFLIEVVIFFAGLIGYIVNIGDVIGMRHVQLPEWTVGMIFHVVGIFIPPLGSIMGLFF